MKIITPGHLYELEYFDDKHLPGQLLQFIEKVPVTPGSEKLRTVNDGTTNEELLAVLIDRLKYLGAKVPSRETSIAETKCEEALLWLEKRTAERKARQVEGTNAK